MPQVYSYSAKFVQPMEIRFQCEYCDHIFTVEGKLLAQAKTEKWVTARTAEAQLELRQRGESSLQRTRTALERFLERGIFPANHISEGMIIKLDKMNTCPACSYRQRMIVRPATPMIQKIFLGIVGFGCGGLALFVYFALLLALIQGFEFPLRPYAIPILIGVPLLAVLGSSLFRNPNRAFMKQHGIKKQDLPQPRQPEIQYGQIAIVG